MSIEPTGFDLTDYFLYPKIFIRELEQSRAKNAAELYGRQLWYLWKCGVCDELLQAMDPPFITNLVVRHIFFTHPEYEGVTIIGFRREDRKDPSRRIN